MACAGAATSSLGSERSASVGAGGSGAPCPAFSTLVLRDDQGAGGCQVSNRAAVCDGFGAAAGSGSTGDGMGAAGTGEGAATGGSAATGAGSGAGAGGGGGAALRSGSRTGTGTGTGTGTLGGCGAGGAGAAASTGSMWAAASNTSLQCPQRTQPPEMRNWSGTTLNMVVQAGQRVIRLMVRRL